MSLEAAQWLPSADATPAAGILLLAPSGRSVDAWGTLPSVLAQSGYRALALESRGESASSSAGEEDGRVEQDLTAALAWLRSASGADPSRLAVIGASEGADIACLASGRGLVRTVVALSPDRDRVHRLARGTTLHIQSALFIGTSGDPGAESSARRLSLETRTPKQVRIFVGAAEKGQAILSARPESVDLILGWLHRTL